VPSPPCPYLVVDGDFHRWLAARPDGTGAQWIRRRRWLERRPGFRIEVARAPGEVARAVEALLVLHRARWAEAGGSLGIAGERAAGFHREAARALAERGWAELWLLHADGAPRAALYGFQRGGRFAFYQSGLDPAWRSRSPGAVLMGAAIERAFARGLDEFDLLHGDEPYKARWADRRRELLHLRLAATRRARAALTVERALLRLRHAAARALPDVALARYRALRARAEGGA
jgi:CelD/BcsL family acetyltransferase involved in cellulose biosynthesis